MPPECSEDDPRRVRRTLASNIAKRRKQIGLSQEDLARHFCCHRQWISRIENGEYNIKANEIPRLCNILQVDIQTLYSEAAFEQPIES